MDLDDVARSAGIRRHDRRRAPSQSIDYTRLSDIDRPGYGDHQAVAQPFAAMPVVEQRADLAVELPRNVARGRDEIVGHVAFVGKVDHRLNQRQRRYQPGPPALRLLAQQAAELPERLAPLRLGFGADEIGQTLDAGEVELAVGKAAAGELAGLRRPQTFHRAERADERRHHGAAAMQVELDGVLAGFAFRRRKPQHQRIVDRLAARCSI